MRADKLLKDLGDLSSGVAYNLEESSLWKFLKENYGLYGAEPAAMRYIELLNRFREECGESEVIVARAPGRVNLIGEHTDYNGGPVLPMAVDRDIVAVACPSAEPIIRIIDQNSDYGERTFTAALPLEPFETGDWGNYPKAAVADLLESENIDGSPVRGFTAMIHSTVPSAGGMSSSSAFVVLTALLFSKVNGWDMERLDLASRMARAERYVGTRGGGMDQAASLCGRPGKALRIGFFPLTVEPVPIPSALSVVVLDSMVKAPKTREARDKYNLRSAECRIAGAVLAKHLLRHVREGRKFRRIGDLNPEVVDLLPGDIESEADRAFHPGPYSTDEAAALLGMPQKEFMAEFLGRGDGSVMDDPPGGFRLYQRFRHVVSESHRVDRARHVMEAELPEALGALLIASHESCRVLHEISCPELDELVSTALSSGALGARMTGAGFGGCVIALVSRDRIASFCRSVGREYYGKRNIPEDLWGRYLFTVEPSGGAGFLE